jgi:fido (protein-threonine AMPylation protein)
LAEKSEKAYLAELVRDFPPEKNIDLEEAWKNLQSRYNILEQQQSQFLDFIHSGKVSFKSSFNLLCQAFHIFLFAEILSNAGEFRKASDPNNGFVGFGREVTRNPSTSQFKGSSPVVIESELNQAFQLLSEIENDPICASIRFYQRFVRIHPFYDGNGRVARVLLTLYLSHHGYYPLWKKLEETKKNEFLKKLNACHFREKEKSFETYFGYLCNFWRNFVIEKKNLTNIP